MTDHLTVHSDMFMHTDMYDMVTLHYHLTQWHDHPTVHSDMFTLQYTVTCSPYSLYNDIFTLQYHKL